MRVYVAIFFLSVLSLGSAAHTVPAKPEVLAYLESYKNTAGLSSISQEKLLSFFNKVEEKRKAFHDETAYLRYIFRKTHARFLKNFKQDAAFAELLSNGSYNCLTGTALYALLLERLDFHYSIIETNYHIFLLVHTAEGNIMFEATDPVNGFINEQREVETRIEQYRRDLPVAANDDRSYYTYRSALYNSISLDNLVGLLHYNLAVNAYNRNDLVSAVSQLKKATERYHSVRVDEFRRILSLTVAESRLLKTEKQNLLNEISSISHPGTITSSAR